MLKLVIFDYDGLMVNSEHVVFAAEKEQFQKYNKELTWEYFCESIGVPVADALKMYMKDHNLPVVFEEFLSERNAYVAKYLESNLALMPGLLSLIKSVKEKGVTMAIATSGKRDYINWGLQKFAISDYFKTVICIDDVERGKPHPDLFLKVLEKESIKPEETIILEDSLHGIEAAYRANIFSIAVPTKGIDFTQYGKAGLIVDSLEKVDNFFRLIN